MVLAEKCFARKKEQKKAEGGDKHSPEYDQEWIVCPKGKFQRNKRAGPDNHGRNEGKESACGHDYL